MTADIAKKIAVSDTLTNEELLLARSFYSDLTDDLELLGPTFRLAANEARRVRELLNGFWNFRRGDMMCEGTAKFYGNHPRMVDGKWVGSEDVAKLG